MLPHFCLSVILAVVCIHVACGHVLMFEPHQVFYEEVKPEGSLKAAPVDHWALIVAGSNGWYNYRHQADACHAYQIMRKHGIPAERIVVMMYDDIANNSENPTPGIIINHPNGSDVYHGVKIDYKGDDVTPQNFLAVLSGKSQLLKNIGTGKVINSGPNDHIFVNFVDHGAPGILAFPADELHAPELIATITEMHTNKKYGQMVFYIEACESGSMFDTILRKDINVYAMTASNAEESSYACYFDDTRQTYLGDVYSVNWMEDSDVENLNKETMHKQFQIVQKETNTSHVMEYGDMSISKETCGEFQGTQTAAPVVVPKVRYDAVPSEDVPLAILYRKLKASRPGEEKAIQQQIQDILEERERVDAAMRDIVGYASRDLRQSNRINKSRYRLTAFDCYMPAVELFDERCFDISQNGYAARRLFLLVNLCEEQVYVETILEAIAKVCKHN
jgi:legumain